MLMQQLLGLGPEYEVTQSMVLYVLDACIETALGVPLQLYRTFVIEQRHGFNKQTPALFVSDTLKGLVLNCLIAPPLLTLFINVIAWGGPHFYIVLKHDSAQFRAGVCACARRCSIRSRWSLWRTICLALLIPLRRSVASALLPIFLVPAQYVSALLFVVQILAVPFYSNVVQPCFNKVEPLPEGTLRASIEKLAASIDFPLTGLYVIDGSKRSSHSNVRPSAPARARTQSHAVLCCGRMWRALRGAGGRNKC